jgi:HAD superfamily phosphoserine phosphatase-like hydrolase
MNLTLFDLDGTLIETDSDHAFGEFLVQVGWADKDHFKQRNDQFYAEYLAGTIDVAAYLDFATAAWRARPEQDALAMRERFMHEVMRPALHKSALKLVQQHQQAGDRVAIVTATNEFVTRPIADLFGIDTLIAVELERDAHGRATGRSKAMARRLGPRGVRLRPHHLLQRLHQRPAAARMVHAPSGHQPGCQARNRGPGARLADTSPF